MNNGTVRRIAYRFRDPSEVKQPGRRLSKADSPWYDYVCGGLRMNLTLNLTAETESRLREWAISTGKAPETVALEAIQEKLSEENAPLPQAASLSEFQTWFDSHPRSLASELDDSRERIYEGRGE